MEELLHEDEIPVGRAKDLRGQVFGKWTVLYRTHNKNGQVYWRVRCECGTERSVYGQTLLRGESRSCGCNTSAFISKALKEDLVGQVFGKLTVIEEDFSRKRTAFKCQCECGNITIVQAGNLKSGHTQSCGCLSVEKTRERNSAKLIGQKFGKLTVIEEAYRKDYSVFWKCQCECGNITFTNSGHLISGHTQSCGCILSKGEENISKILRNNKIEFTSQKSFEQYYDFEKKEGARPFRFDFFVKNQYLIEFDGRQHFEAIDWFGGEEQLLAQTRRDQYKNQWCKENNIPLIRIPYTKLDTLCIEDLMLETTQFRVV